MFGGADNVIFRKGVDGDSWDVTVQRYVVRCAARVTRFITHRGGNRVLPVTQAEEVTARHEDRPRSVCPDGGLIAVPIEGDGHRLALFRRGGTADGLARQLLGIVNDVVIGHGADGHGRRDGIHR